MRSSRENEVASPVVPSTLRPSQPLSSRKRASLVARATSGAPSSVTGVATAAMTPESVLVTVLLTIGSPYVPLAADVICRQCRHVDQLIVLGAELHDLHRPVEADQKRSDHGGAAQLLQHLGRDRGRVER